MNARDPNKYAPELRRQVKSITPGLSGDPEQKRSGSSKRQTKNPITIKIGQEVNKKPIKTGKNRVYHYVTVENRLI